ncbi:MAG: hypothetical protein N3A54_03035 [Patescibacteria group bacterium]|nr:hypothetical protein [Patescibacteria group bacterium]
MDKKPLIKILISELQKKNIFAVNDEDLYKKLDTFSKNFSFLHMMQKKYPEIDDKFLNTIDKLSIEQLLILKFQNASQRIGGDILPKWFFEKLHEILQYIIVKYYLSTLGSFSKTLQYLEIDKKDFEKILGESDIKIIKENTIGQ